MVQLPGHIENINMVLSPDFINNHPFINQKNIFYTAGSVSINNRKTLLEQTIVPFDVDNIPTGEDIQHYVAIFSMFVGIPSSDFVTIDTGHGLHFLVGINIPLTDPSVFETHRRYYKLTCDALNSEFAKANLRGRMDTSVFKNTQLLRMPNTINHKPKKYNVDSLCTYISGKATPQPLDLIRLSGIEKHQVPQSQQLQQELTPADTKAVLAGCDFLKMCASGVSLTEPQWYGMLGILSKCKDGRKAAHDISSLDATRYDSHDTDRKFDQADASCKGRLCSSILPLWDGCETCPNFNIVNTPLMIRGDDYIATEHTSFHYIKDNIPKPSISDLVKYLLREKNFILFPRTREVDVYQYTGTHWKYIEYPRFIGYINDLYKPEFVDPNVLVRSANAFFAETAPMQVGEPTDPSNYISLANGDFAIDSLELVPHNKNHRSFSMICYDYAPDAKCPKFLKFMSEVFTSDVYINNVLEFFASALFNLPNHTYDKCLILYGPMSNGKSTLANIMTCVLGKENVSADTMSEKSFEKIGGLTTVIDKKLNISEESDWSLFSSPQFKNIISGGMLTINPKNKSLKTIKFNTKLMFCTNDIPKARTSVEAIAKRVMLCDMPNCFDDNDPRQNKNLANEICTEELPGILNLLVEAGKRLLTRGRYNTSTTEYQKMTEVFKLSTNDVLAWASEHLEVCDEHSIPVKDVYSVYSNYCRDNNMYAENIKQFAKTMRSAYDYGVTIRDGDKTIRVLKGYKLKEDFDGTI